MIIQHNITALNAYRQLGNNNNMVSKNLEKLSSGYKINRAGDDAAGLAISEKMRSQIKGLETAQKNANDGISLIQTAEGALTEVHSMLNRMVELATQSANGTYTDDDRIQLHKEVNTLRSEIDRISEGTNFNGINLLDGKLGGYALSAQPAAADAAGTGLSISGGNISGVAVALTLSTDKFNGAFTIDGVAINTTTNATGLSFNLTYVDKDGKSVTAKGKSWTDIQGITLGNGGVTLELVVTKGAGVLQNDYDKYNGVKINFSKTAAKGSIAATTAGSSGLNLQIGDTNKSYQKVNVVIGHMDSATLGIDLVDISNETTAGTAIDRINTAINTVSSTRADLGALQNRLEHTINNLGVTTENMSAAESRIRDTDMAKEMMTYTKNNILTQAAQAMLAQANQLPQGVLQLLR